MCAFFHFLPPLLWKSVSLAPCTIPRKLNVGVFAEYSNSFSFFFSSYSISKTQKFSFLSSFASPTLLLSLWLTGPPVWSGQLPDWHWGSRKWCCDWLLRDSAGIIRSFNTSRCLSWSTVDCGAPLWSHAQSPPCTPQQILMSPGHLLGFLYACSVVFLAAWLSRHSDITSAVYTLKTLIKGSAKKWNSS